MHLSIAHDETGLHITVYAEERFSCLPEGTEANVGFKE